MGDYRMWLWIFGSLGVSLVYSVKLLYKTLLLYIQSIILLVHLGVVLSMTPNFNNGWHTNKGRTLRVFPPKISSHIVLTQNQLSFGHLGTFFTIWLLKRLPHVSLNKWINLTTATCSVLRRSSMIWWVPRHSCPLTSSDSLWSFVVLSIFPRLFDLRTGTHIVIVCCVPPLQSWQWLVEMAVGTTRKPSFMKVNFVTLLFYVNNRALWKVVKPKVLGKSCSLSAASNSSVRRSNVTDIVQNDPPPQTVACAAACHWLDCDVPFSCPSPCLSLSAGLMASPAELSSFWKKRKVSCLDQRHGKLVLETDSL